MTPQILLTFANRSEGDPGYLRALPGEMQAIKESLRDAVEAHLCGLHIEPEITRHGLIEHLQTPAAVEHVVVFHYAGHASGSALALGRGQANADGVAAMLGRLPRLQLAFLNGCSTQAQVDALLAVGVRVVVATRVDVKDLVASDFAQHFYRRLGDGATIRQAFQAAEDVVKVNHPDATDPRDVSRGSLRIKKKRPAEAAPAEMSQEALEPASKANASVPWGLHAAPTRAGEPDPLDWSVPLAADDPLFVLPRPAPMAVSAPYRGAEPYRAEDAAIFLGRGHEVRAAYDALMAGESTVVVLHGPAGVGRTSLLQAGLLSRLRVSARAAAVLPETLEELETAGLEVLLVDEAERLATPQVGAALQRAPRVLFAVREDGYSTLMRAITATGRAAVPIALAHLDEPAIARVIAGSTRLFPLRYAPALSARLANDLAGHGSDIVLDATGPDAPGMVDRTIKPRSLQAEASPTVAGATTPVTSMVLTALWLSREGDEVLDAQYEKYKHDGYLDVFVRAGLDGLAAQKAEWVESGFALDLLAHHMTLLGKLKGHTLDRLKARYAHRDDVHEFVEAACIHRLLVRTADSQGTLLAHDLLAPLIGSRYARSRAPAQQARRIIEERLPSWADGGEGPTLDADDLLTIESGRLGMPVLNADGLRLTEASARAVVAQARRRRILRTALGGAVVLVLALAFLWNQRREEARYATAKAKLAEIESRVAKSEAAELTRARALSGGLVEAYRALEDPNPRRAHRGVLELAALVRDYGALVPAVARLALRSWTMVLADPGEARARAARPNVVSQGAQSRWIDMAGRSHALAVPPDRWFVLPSGQSIAIHSETDQRLRTYNTHTGALIATHVMPQISSIVQFDDPGQVIVVEDLKTVAEDMRLLILDGKSGAGASVHVSGGWGGDCSGRIFARPEVDGVPVPHEQAAWMAFEFDAEGALRRSPPSDTADEASLDDCVRKVVPAQAPAPDGAGLIEPAWRRWASVPMAEDEQALALTGRRAPVPPAPAGDGSSPPDQGCDPGCAMLDPPALEFKSAQGAVLAGVGGCTDAMHSLRVARVCRGDRSTTAPVRSDMADLDTVEATLAASRRRGDYLLIAGHLIRLSDLGWVPLDVAGAPRDFALSPSEARLVVLTDTRVLVFDADADGRLRAGGAVAADATQGAVLRARFLDEDTLIMQRARDVLAMRLGDQRVLWRRPEQWHRTDRHNAGLAIGSSLGGDADLIVVRRGDRVRLLAATDGTPLTPVERVVGLDANAAVAIDVTASGGVRVRDGGARFERAALPSAVDAAGFIQRQAAPPAEAPLAEVRAPAGIMDSGPRCAPAAVFHRGECWPEGAPPPGATPTAARSAAAVCAGGGPDLAFLHRLLDHLITQCIPEDGRQTYGCGVLDTFNASLAGDSLHGPQAATRLKMLLRVRALREAAVDQAVAWVRRCRPDAVDRLQAALTHLDASLTAYDARTFEACESECGAPGLNGGGLAPQTRESDACVARCWATRSGTPVEGMRGMLRFIHTRRPRGVSPTDLKGALTRARAALDRP